MACELAKTTLAGYESHWRLFSRWCETAEAEPLPATRQTVRDFTTWCLNEGYRTSTVSRFVAGIGHKHRVESLPDPTHQSGIYEYIGRARRERQEKPHRKKAVTCNLLCQMLKSVRRDRVGVRDRAMILLTFAAGWRRSEVVALQYADVQFAEKGILLFQGRSKTDQAGEGRFVGVHRGRRKLTCPVRTLEEWLEIRGDWSGPLFCCLTPKDHKIVQRPLHERAGVIYYALKDALSDCGEDPRPYGAHSLRAGMITEAAKHGASEVAIRLRTGHKDMNVLQSYIRPATAFDFDPLAGVL